MDFLRPEEALKRIFSDDAMERLTGSDKPYQRCAFGAAQWLKTYAQDEKNAVGGRSAFESWCVVDVDDMINQVKIEMDDMEDEWREECKDCKPSVQDTAYYNYQYLIKWFTLQNLNDLKKEHGKFKHCADMVEPAEVIVLDD